jgi:hypothetical protein
MPGRPGAGIAMTVGGAAASYPSPCHLPSSGIEGAGEHVKVIGPSGEVLPGRR